MKNLLQLMEEKLRIKNHSAQFNQRHFASKQILNFMISIDEFHCLQIFCSRVYNSTPSINFGRKKCRVVGEVVFLIGFLRSAFTGKKVYNYF